AVVDRVGHAVHVLVVVDRRAAARVDDAGLHADLLRDVLAHARLGALVARGADLVRVVAARPGQRAAAHPGILGAGDIVGSVARAGGKRGDRGPLAVAVAGVPELVEVGVCLGRIGGPHAVVVLVLDAVAVPVSRAAAGRAQGRRSLARHLV